MHLIRRVEGQFVVAHTVVEHGIAGPVGSRPRLCIQSPTLERDLIHEKKISSMKDLLPVLEEKKARVEDAMHATKAAVEEGIVPGGGVALLRASKALQQLKLDGDEQIGVNIITRAIEEPMRWIATNAGHEGSIVVQKVQAMKDEEGFNAQTETYENLAQAGVIDPAKVVRSNRSELACS
jgi:chaperonin GroEL (HSP60 family)